MDEWENWDSLERKLDDINKFNKESKDLNIKIEKYWERIYIGWQCPVCWEVYNPHIMNCMNNHNNEYKKINNTL
jgi:hypothetical protein